jgi:hypothetical protein
MWQMGAGFASRVRVCRARVRVPTEIPVIEEKSAGGRGEARKSQWLFRSGQLPASPNPLLTVLPVPRTEGTGEAGPIDRRPPQAVAGYIVFAKHQTKLEEAG